MLSDIEVTGKKESFFKFGKSSVLAVKLCSVPLFWLLQPAKKNTSTGTNKNNFIPQN